MDEAGDKTFDRATILDALQWEMRKSSAHSVLFSHAVAERVGMRQTDMESLDLMYQEGPLTAGRLAELTGLTTGAITGLIDRLERAGYVRRRQNPNDRRSVIVEPLREKVDREIGPLFTSLAGTMAALGARYDDKELAVILDFFTQANSAMQQEIARLREEPPERVIS